MDYCESVAWVHSLGRFSAEAGRVRMKKLMAALGNPERALRFAHVAGTNGKGSTVAMLSSILAQAGYKTGTNISPYILRFNERFMINGKMIADARLAAVIEKVKNAAKTLGEPLIEFEAVTAAALLYFAEEHCDIAVVEAGMGGGNDSTNVIENTEVVCITKIGYDHTDILGDTLAKIAAEKCGIFKNHCDVVSYPEQEPEALDEIIKACARQDCRLVLPAVQDFVFYRAPNFENRFNYGGYDLNLPMPGRHQAMNAAVALEAALCLWRRGFDRITDEAIVSGIEQTRFPARIEVVSTAPLVIVDGAHNPDSAKALAATLLAAGAKGLSAVCGILRDKNAEEILAMLSPYIGTLYTVTPDSPRALTAEELAAIAAPLALPGGAVPCPSLGSAMTQALNAPGNGVLVFGSLYLAAEARAWFEGRALP